MKLNSEQIEFYHNKGYIVLKELFSTEEVDSLNKVIERFDSKGPLENIIREKDGEIRSIFAPHLHEKAFNTLYKQDRVVDPVEQLVGGQVYLYQYKLNNKKALKGEWWEWHQDFPYWHLDDGVKEPDMISIMVLLQDTELLQGPLLLIPGTHKDGVVDFEPKNYLKQQPDSTLENSVSSDLKYTVKKEFLISKLKQEDVIVAKGKAGDCIFFHPNIFHASNANLSPYDRNTAIITYNKITNLPDTAIKRPTYLCARDFSPIKAENSIVNE